MIAKTIKDLQVILKSNGAENINIIFNRKKEKINATNLKETINISYGLKNQTQKTRVEVVNSLSEEEIQSFNKNFYPSL
jgi:hypothetical protein